MNDRPLRKGPTLSDGRCVPFWNAPEGTKKVSPVEASRQYLEHIRKAWDHTFPDAPFDQQQILVTVPAGAKTGSIKIKTPGGKATSSASFTVTP